MSNALLITFGLIALSTILGAFLKGRSKDKCLLNLEGYLVNVKLKSGKEVWGNLVVEPTGLELLYEKDHIDSTNGNIERSYILYKSEFPELEVVLRYHDALDEKQKLKRKKELRRYYERKPYHGFKRKIRNFFLTVRDALVEVTNILIGRLKAAKMAGGILSGQDKYVSKMQESIIPGEAPHFEPLLEKYIAKKVVFSIKKGEGEVEYSGILKEYSPDFIEVLDVTCRKKQEGTTVLADVVVSRQMAVVRHLGG